MSRNNTERIDSNSLKSFASLQSYCTDELGEPTVRGNEIRYHCPFCSPGSPNLTIREVDGIGLWKCWSCDEKGDIYNLSAKLQGKDTKTHFTEILNCISSATVAHTIDGTIRKSTPIPRKNEEHIVPSFLPEKDEALLWQAVDKMCQNKPVREQLAKELGISPVTLLARAQFHELGAVGISPDNRLLYIYVEMDNIGTCRITGCKLRSRQGHSNPYLKIEQGQWKSYGTMNPTPANPKGARFIYPAGKPFNPWGIADLQARGSVVITEGESDALAISEAYNYMREIYSGATDEHTGRPFENIHGHLDSQIPAILSVSGVSGFRREWARLFTGKRIILAFDSDEPGQKATLKTMELLSPFGTVHNWVPPQPCKDARELLQKYGPSTLLASIIQSIGKGGNHA